MTLRMTTDDERREVAERLREKSRKYARELSSSHTSINAYHEVREVLYGTDGSPKSLCEFFDRLADLIDPDCEEGRYSVARTVRPVDREAESGHESGQNPDTVQIESPTVQKATACDGEGCGRVTPDEPESHMHEAGWARVRVWGGEDYDLCPECARKALSSVGIRGVES